MNQITALTDDPRQSLTISLDDNSKVSFSLVFREQQQGWFYSLIYGEFSLNNRRLVTSPNILRQFKNIIPFGIFIDSTDNLDPAFLEDFSSGRILFYVLNSEDVLTVEEDIYDPIE